MNNSIKIHNREISEGSKVFIIGELSANHNGSIEKAIEIIREAAKAGVDAIKLQTYTPDTITIDCDDNIFKIGGGTLWDGRVLYDLYEEAYTPWEWHERLFKVAEEEGVICFSSPFDISSVDFLEKLNCPAYKIASPEIVDIPLIEYVASKGKPMIISIGIATISEIEEALNACRKMNNYNVILLKCTSSYPAPFEDMNLKTIENMKETFDCVVGLSDHTMGDEVSVASVALGAKVIEKHITLDREDKGPDSEFSLNIEELSDLVKSIRNVEKAIGKVSYDLTKSGETTRSHRRSLFVVEDIKSGEIFTSENIRSIRPGNGVSPKHITSFLGKKSRQDIKKGTPLDFEFLDNQNS